MNEIKNTLEIIEADIKYQTQLLETIVENIDENRNKSETQKDSLKKNMEMFQAVLVSNPVIKSNPQLLNAISEMFSTLK